MFLIFFYLFVTDLYIFVVNYKWQKLEFLQKHNREAWNLRKKKNFRTEV